MYTQPVTAVLVVIDAAASPDRPIETAINTRGYLAGLDHDVLVDLLVARAAEDEIVHVHVHMSAARATKGAPPMAVFRHALDEAFLVRDYVDYRRMYDYARTIDSALDSLVQLRDDGRAGALITLAEHAIDRAEDALGLVDDPDGYLSGIAERMQELHRDACAAARPEPVALARALFARELHAGDLEVLYGAAASYAAILRAEGIGEYGRLAQEEWDALPALGPGQDERSYASRRFRVTKIMETLAELTKDVDVLVDVLARDQSSAYQFVRIAKLYRSASRYDDALAWAEKGLALHGGSDPRVLEAAAEDYHRAGRGADAVLRVWEAYSAAPTLRTYRPVAEQATRAEVWPDLHERAVMLLRGRIEQVRRKPAGGRAGAWGTAVDTSTLVEMLLYDGDVELAWVEATAAGCRRDLWLELARRREAEHPPMRSRSGRARSSGSSQPRTTRRTPKRSGSSSGPEASCWLRAGWLTSRRTPRTCARRTSPTS